MNNKDINTNDTHGKLTRVDKRLFPSGNFMKISLRDYIVKREIGRGGMAIVYEAVEKSLNRIVALKMLSKEFGKDTELVRRFVNEAQAAAKVNHPNIVQIYSIGQEQGIYYFAMELVRGKSVERLLEEEKRISVMQSLIIVRQTTLALAEAYKNGIVHRDIKPGNILITEHGVVKVADFGLAAAVKGTSVKSGNKIIGTPFYISPEQVQGREGDYRSDMYSLGITFYQMLAGSTPFVQTDTKMLMNSHVEKPLPVLPNDIPISIRKLVTRLTAKDPEKRFPSYDMLLDEINSIYKKISARRYTIHLLSLLLVFTIVAAVFNFTYKPKPPEIILPTHQEKYKMAKERYNDVVSYAKSNPQAQEYIIKKYLLIIKEFPDSEWAFRADEKIDQIIRTLSVIGDNELQNLKAEHEKLLKERRYGEAVDKYEKLAKKYKDSPTETYAREYITYIMEEARGDFQRTEEQAKRYINDSDYDNAKTMYRGVIDKFGLDEYVKAAENKIDFISEVRKQNNEEKKARSIYNSVEYQVEESLKNNKYDEAKQLLEDLLLVNDNKMLKEIINEKIVQIDDAQVDYESNILKTKMEEQYGFYSSIDIEVSDLISRYKYIEAVDVVEKGIVEIDVKRWKDNLENLLEKLNYLILFKNGIIKEITKELSGNNITNVYATQDTLIYVVGGGYVGVPWAEVPPSELYQIGKKYLGGNAQDHLILGVFCITYGLDNDARKEFALAIRTDKGMQKTVEKYLIQLTETNY